MLIIVINILIFLLIPFIFVGVINKTKAFWGGRKGASVLQPFYDFIKLLKKDFLINKYSSSIFKIAPVITFVSIFMAGLFVPIIKGISIISFEGSFILFCYILGFGKFFSLIGAMDTGSSFEGMGASREAGFSVFVESAFFVIMASIMALSHNYTFKSLSLLLANGTGLDVLILVLAFLSLGIMLLVEGCRVPVDDPNTHLELTMIHEVMVLDNSGFDLALISYGSALKMIIFASLMANLILPLNLGLVSFVLLYLVVILGLAMIIGTVESSFARLRMTHVYEFIFVMSSFSLIIVALAVMKIYGG